MSETQPTELSVSQPSPEFLARAKRMDDAMHDSYIRVPVIPPKYVAEGFAFR